MSTQAHTPTSATPEVTGNANQQPGLGIVPDVPAEENLPPDTDGAVGAMVTEASASVIPFPQGSSTAPKTSEGTSPEGASRRGFLKWVGVSVVGVVAASGGAVAVVKSRGESSEATTGTGLPQQETKPGELTRETSARIITYDKNPLYEKLTPEERAIIDKLGQAEWDGYSAFPVEERRLFAQFMWLGQAPYAMAMVAETNQTERYEAPVRASKSNSNQEIVDQWSTRFAALTWVLTRNGSSSPQPAKRTLALKMLDGLYTDSAHDDDYDARVTSLLEIAQVTGANDGYQRYTAINGTETKDPAGRRIDFYINGGSRQRQMILATFPAVAGHPQEEVWLTARSYSPSDPEFMQLGS